MAADDLLERIATAAAPTPPTVDADQRPLPVGIDGVHVERLRPHVDHRGSLTPFLNVASGFWSEPIVYGYVITVAPGRIKGWGMHERQADRYAVLGGDVRVALFDGRADSPTAGRSASVFFSARTPGLIRIPPGVWHADQNWGSGDVVIVNLPTRAYDPAAPDKLHIDVDAGVIPFDFTLRDA